MFYVVLCMLTVPSSHNLFLPNVEPQNYALNGPRNRIFLLTELLMWDALLVDPRLPCRKNSNVLSVSILVTHSLMLRSR